MNFTSNDTVLLALLKGPGAEAPWRPVLEALPWLGALSFDDPALALERAAGAPRTLFLLDASLAVGEAAFWVDLIRSCALGPLIWIGDPGASSERRQPHELALSAAELPETEQDWRSWIDECWVRFACRRHELLQGDGASGRPLSVDDAFIADSLHEFRTPVTVVQQFALLIRDGLAGEVSERQIEYLERIRIASRHIVTLFDDFRLSTRARLGAMPKVRGKVGVAPLLLACVADIGPELMQVDVGVPGSSLAINGDDEVLGVVLSRLASYCVARAAEGERVRLGIGPPGETHVEIHMRYRGQGPTDHEIMVFHQGVLQDGLQRRSVTKVFGVGVELARTLLLFGDGKLFLARRAADEGELRVQLPLYPSRAQGSELAG